MPCIRIGGAIVCFSNMRKFKYKKKDYFVEENGGGRSICDEDGCGVFIEDFKKRKRSKFYKEMTLGVTPKKRTRGNR